MKSWLKSVLGLSGLLLVAGCADGNAYPAPYGSTIEAASDTISLSGPGGITLLEAIVVDPNQGEDGMLLANTRVTVQGSSLAAILVPESAISTLTSASDTDWVCHADEEPAVEQCTSQCVATGGGSEDECHSNCRARECAEQYYDWTQIDLQISPNYLETSTDSHGIVKVYVLSLCLPTDLGWWGSSEYGCIEEFAEDATVTEFPVLMSIGVDAVDVTFTSDAKPPVTPTTTTKQ